VDLVEQAHRVKFMIRDRGSNFTAAFGPVLAAGIRTALCIVRTPRMNAIAPSAGSADVGASCWTAPSSGTRAICGGSCAIARPTTISTDHTGPWAALPR
jgi:hypothetical protein